MQIIPVIDILKGQAVHAYCGRRDTYQPVRTSLCKSPEPAGIITAFLDLHPFRSIYIADLDAIENKTHNNALIEQLTQRFPDVEFWIDRGRDGASPFPAGRTVPVLGTETRCSGEQLADFRGLYPDTVLSLDFNHDGLMGDENLLDHSDDWPQRCIIMGLHRVGTSEGPDLSLLETLMKQQPERDYFVAGGVRNADDLEKARDAGAAGILLASALHNGSITAKTLRAFGRK